MPSSTKPSLPTIFLNGRFLSQRVTGIQRYARETLLELDNILANQTELGFNIKLLIPRGITQPTLRAIEVEECGWFNGHLWEQFDLPWRVGNQLLFSFCSTGPLFKKNQIITIHDLSVFRIPEAFSRSFRWWYKVIYSVIASRSKLTMTVSQFSAKEISQCLGISTGRIRVATEGWQHLQQIDEDAAILRKFELENKAFALAVSSPTPNKNFGCIVKAFHLLGTAAPLCVAAGKADMKVFNDGVAAVDIIQPLGYVSDGELKSLYKSATCFIFPSFYEGFGIPPLEAMACGCPVLAADIPTVKEICGDSALYFDPHHPEQLSKLIQEIMGNSAIRQKLSQSGIERARQFSWTEGARLNLSLLKEALKLA
jgi:glycosyltransferase involved in cell wall biosynthesis